MQNLSASKVSRKMFGLGLVGSAVFACFSSFAANLFVSNNGLDSNSCGFTNPCRSISQAILNAGPGDTIIVGPGVYGDAEQGPSTGCNCLINVNNDLTIVSRDGASVTIIDAASSPNDAVIISAHGATFGGVKKGFTITDANGNGVIVSNGLGKVKVIGNRSIANGRAGFLVSDGTVSNLLSGNISLGNNIGLEVHGFSNFVLGNAAEANSRDGFRLFGAAHVLMGNVANDNNFYGFNVGTNSVVTLTHNATLSNTRFGILVNSNATATIKQNDIFGNNEQPVNVFGTNGVTNCGLANDSFRLLTLSGNYFGAPTGPGANPADAIVNFSPSSVTTNPSFSKKEIKIKPITP